MISRESVVSKKVDFTLLTLENGEQARVRKLGGLRYSTLLDWWSTFTEAQKKSSSNNLEFAAKLAVAVLVNEDGSYMFQEEEYALLVEQEWLFDLQAQIFKNEGWFAEEQEGEAPKGKD